MGRFEEKYTTKEKKTQDPEKEADKMEISNDSYAIREGIEEILDKLEHIRRSAKW